jgi:hypothetical protein
MKGLATLLLIASTYISSAALYAEQSGGPYEFSDFLRNRPLELGQLLGKHLSEVAPDATWESLPIAEEYKNSSIRYGVFVRESLHDYMKAWSFMTDDYCVSTNSFFLIFFNRGFVFRVELRFLPDSFTGSINSNSPQHCADETPVFRMIAKALGGKVTVRDNSYELVRYSNNYLMILNAGGGNASLNWHLRGGPSSQNF